MSAEVVTRPMWPFACHRQEWMPPLRNMLRSGK
jgi:hypothetical protein